MKKHLAIIIKKELLVSFRSKQLHLIFVIISILLLTAGVGGYLNYSIQKEQIAHAKHEKREQWLHQGDKNPHIASHYGTFVFKPKTGLSFFDYGIDAYTGSSIYLEAHYQHEFMFRPAQDFGAMIRFGELSLALVMQLLIPLLIIFLTFTAFTKEEENGTLKIVMSQGFPFRTLAWGKIMAYTIIIFIVLLPVTALLMIGIFTRPQLSLSGDLFVRLFLLITSYSLYFFVFICVCVWVSSKFNSSNNALLTLLSVWFVFNILSPKAIASIATTQYSLPSINSFQKNIKDDVESKIVRDPKKDTLIINFTKRLLKQYQVKEIAQLPINYEPAYAQVYEDFSNRIHDKHSVKLYQQIEQQNKMSSYASVLNPYLAIRDLSMGLAATDFYTYSNFQAEAEDYRRNLVRKMNMDYRDHSKTGEFYEYRAGIDLWRSLKDFEFILPNTLVTVKQYVYEILSLILWVCFSVILINYFTSKPVS